MSSYLRWALAINNRSPPSILVALLILFQIKGPHNDEALAILMREERMLPVAKVLGEEVASSEDEMDGKTRAKGQRHS